MSVDDLKNKLAELYSHDSSNVFVAGNARSAILLTLNSLGLDKNSKVATTAYTCRAAVNPILWAGCDPVYIDLPDDLSSINMCPTKLGESFKKNDIKVVVVQPTFGSFKNIKKLIEVSKKNNAVVLLDLAHCFGVTKSFFNQVDFLIISTGLQKMMPKTRVGGAVLCRNSNLAEALMSQHKKLKKLPLKDKFLWRFDKYFWKFSSLAGSKKSTAISLFKKLNFISDGFFESEVQGSLPKRYPYGISESICKKISSEADNLIPIIEKRKSFCTAAHQHIKSSLIDTGKDPLIRYPVLSDDEAHKLNLQDISLRFGLSPTNWYDSVLFPNEGSLENFSYKKGQCPNAEEVAGRIVSFETHSSSDNIESFAKKINELS